MSTVIWFTGLSGSGKSTISSKVKSLLENRNYKVLELDGDTIREKFHFNKLGFTPPDIVKNNLFIASVCKEQQGLFDVILVPVISPFEKTRNEVQEMLNPNLSFVFCNANLSSVQKRDVKGLYAKNPNMIGVDPNVPYEIPLFPDLILKTGIDGDQEDKSVLQLFDFILKKLTKGNRDD